MELRHIGYGAAFNSLTVSTDGSTLVKRSRTSYGHAKLLQEIAFYDFLRTANIAFPVPRLIHADAAVPEYSMEYIQDAPTLASVFPTLDLAARHAAVTSVWQHLRTLHCATARRDIAAARLRDCIAAECNTKLRSRYAEIADVLEPIVGHIETVNGLRIPNMFDAIELVYRRILDVFETRKDLGDVCAIHGDCHFNNILVRPGKGLVFLDPRGQFGDLAVYGLAAYDFAKVRFALTGYSAFDAMADREIPLEIVGTSATTGDLFQLPRDEVLGGPDDLETLLVLTIWLGNAHCFRAAPRKAAFSALYARWLTALVLGGDGNPVA